MGVIEEILNGFVAGAGDNFLQDYEQDIIRDANHWSTYEGKSPEDFLDRICEFRLLERYTGHNLLTHEFCKFGFVDKAEEIVAEFGREKALSFMTEQGKYTKRAESDQTVLATFILSVSLPGSKRVAEYAAAKIREKESWKYLVSISPVEAE